MKTAILTLPLALRLAARVALAALFLLLIAAAPARADKCTGAKLKAIAKKEAGLLGCQSKVASKNDSSGLLACETKVMGKFSAAFGKAGTCAGDQTACENIADSCDSAVAAFLTDTFPSKCEAAKRKAAGKLSSGELGCYSKAASKGLPLDASCITKAQGKFGAAFTKAGTCPDGGSPQSEVENNCVQPLVTTNGGGVVTDVCPPSCTDGIKDGTETAVDCGGGTCPACPLGEKCSLDSDCTSNACDAVSLTCVANQCADHRQDGTETDVDCGGGTCPACPLGEKCHTNSDCQFGLVCLTGTCH